ncbi:MAG: L-serine ammonia-lyase, iron-sulfur-dependent, subunit alpha [Eubacteriaceae bacterium]|nr:L-serine ammonia-lyase, iron-sulfur-dependent, subunit alpha [Eubacteriaceae bacterium]
MVIKTSKGLLELCELRSCSLSDLLIEYEAENSMSSAQQAISKMKDIYGIMEESAVKAQESNQGLSLRIMENDSAKIHAAIEAGRVKTSPLLANAICFSMSVSAVNASMGRIVACPTAGSCGVLPGVLLSLVKDGKTTREAAGKSLFNAAGIGILISENATLAGAVGGCQAEIGSACAMAASAACECLGGSPIECINAAAFALKGLLGLVCDPVAGLVETPCSKRNALACCMAFGAAEMALCGIESTIPFDEVISAMAAISLEMPVSLKETARGGLAATKTAKELEKKIFG